MLTPEEAAAEWEEFENQRQNRDLIVDSVGGAGYPPGVISYNEFWYERGSETIASRRTSLIYDPPNGRIPELNQTGKQRREDYRNMIFNSAGPEGPHNRRSLPYRLHRRTTDDSRLLQQQYAAGCRPKTTS